MRAIGTMRIRNPRRAVRLKTIDGVATFLIEFDERLWLREPPF